MKTYAMQWPAGDAETAEMVSFLPESLKCYPLLDDDGAYHRMIMRTEDAFPLQNLLNTGATVEPARAGFYRAFGWIGDLMVRGFFLITEDGEFHDCAGES